MRHSRGSRRRVAGGDSQRGLAPADPKRTARDECPPAGTPLGRPVRRRPARCWPAGRSLAGRAARGSRFLLFLNIKRRQDDPELRHPAANQGKDKAAIETLASQLAARLFCGRGSPVSLVSPVTRRTRQPCHSCRTEGRGPRRATVSRARVVSTLVVQARFPPAGDREIRRP